MFMEQVAECYWTRWPNVLEYAVDLPMDSIELTAQQINWLFDGYDLTRLQGHASLAHHTVL